MKTLIKKVLNILDIIVIIYVIMCVIIACAEENALIFFVYPLPAVIYFEIRESNSKK